MKKTAFITLLSILILSTSVFLIMESAKYYQKFYQAGWQGVFLAILLEAFVITLAVSKVYRLPLRIIQKGLMLAVFAIIVMTASLHHAAPIFQSISQSKNQNKVSNLIQQEMNNLKNDLTIFDKQNQKRNSALSAKKRHSIFKELLQTAKNTNQVSFAAYLDIAILILIRLVLQTCNIFCASMVGNYYRKREVKIWKKKPVLKLRKNRNKCNGSNSKSKL